MEIRRRFHLQLEHLKMTILDMATLTERALEKALQAYFERDPALAGEVIEGDQEINLLEVKIDRYCLKLLALDQPMAKDLRFIMGCMRMAVDLERIADQAVNIAERTLFLANRPPLPPNPTMEELAQTALDMIKTVISAFVNENTDQAYDVCQMDDRADELNARVLKKQINYILNEIPAVERSIQTIIAARCIERAADLATNIAESVIFIVKGVNIKHHCES